MYQPGEDSYILRDYLVSEYGSVNNSDAKVFVEMGSGSGYVSSELARSVPNRFFLAVDINMEACVETRTKLSGLMPARCFDVVNGSLLSFVRPGWLPDVAFFNPPYLESERLNSVAAECSGKNSSYQTLVLPGSYPRDIRASYMGGIDGCEITVGFVDQLVGLALRVMHGIREDTSSSVRSASSSVMGISSSVRSASSDVFGTSSCATSHGRLCRVHLLLEKRNKMSECFSRLLREFPHSKIESNIGLRRVGGEVLSVTSIDLVVES